MVRRDQVAVYIEKRKPVLNGLDRVPQPPFRNLHLLVGDGQVRFDLLVFRADRFHLRAGRDNLFGQGARMAAQFLIGREQLGLFEFQKPFSRQSGAPFLGQFLGKIHLRPRFDPESLTTD